MNRALIILAAGLIASVQAHSHQTVTRQVRSEVPFIIVYGHFVYPEKGIYTATLTDSTVVVNGVIYVPPEKHDIPSPEPDREKDFFDWAIRYPALGAQAIIDSGGTEKQARTFIDDFYAALADSAALCVRFNKGTYHLTWRGKEARFTSPRQRTERGPDYWENTLSHNFEDLCRQLKAGNLLIAGEGGYQLIPREEVPEIAPQLRAIPKTGRSASAIILHSERGDVHLSPLFLEDILRQNK